MDVGPFLFLFLFFFLLPSLLLGQPKCSDCSHSWWTIFACTSVSVWVLQLYWWDCEGLWWWMWWWFTDSSDRTQDEGHLLTLWKWSMREVWVFCGSASARYWVCYSSCQWGAHGARKEGAVGASDLPKVAVWLGTAARASGGTWKRSGHHFLFSYVKLFFPCCFYFNILLQLFFFIFAHLILLPCSPLSTPEAAGQPWWEVEHKLMILPDWIYFPCDTALITLIPIIFNWKPFFTSFSSFSYTDKCAHTTHTCMGWNHRAQSEQSSWWHSLSFSLHQISWWHAAQALINRGSSSPHSCARQAWLTGRATHGVTTKTRDSHPTQPGLLPSQHCGWASILMPHPFLILPNQWRVAEGLVASKSGKVGNGLGSVVQNP